MAHRLASAITLAGSLTALALGLGAPTAAQATFLTPAPCDFVTGGGFVFKDNGMMVNYGIHAGCKHNKFWGHINYIDHENQFHLRSVEITGYIRETLSDGTVLVNTRDFCGWAQLNSQEGLVRFRVTVTDNGEPGVNDTFGISIDGVHQTWDQRFYIVTDRTVGGGNIQLHKPNPSTTSPGFFSQTQQCGDLTGPNAP